MPSQSIEAMTNNINSANEHALHCVDTADPVLVDIRPAAEVVPGMTRNTILASGASLAWERYTGGQRAGIIGGALYEGLADTPDAVDAAIRAGDIEVRGCQDLDCIGSLAGIYTASMPVLVVEDRAGGRRAYCSLFEGEVTARLNYGVYNAAVRDNLKFLEHVIGPLLGEAVRRSEGGVALRPIMRRALHMGDELHSRNTGATLLFTRALLPQMLELARHGADQLDDLVRYLSTGDYFFLRASMAAAKVMADSMRGIAGSSLVSAMAFSCCEFSIRVAGLGDRWFRGPLPRMESGRLFDGHSPDDIEMMGGESVVTEVVGLGGFAQAAAFPLQAYQGGTPQHMIERNLQMYEITVAENSGFRLPFFEYRGTPTGIDIRKVSVTGITPVMDIGIAGRDGGQIGAGCYRAPLEPFQDALRAFQQSLDAPIQDPDG